MADRAFDTAIRIGDLAAQSGEERTRRLWRISTLLITLLVSVLVACTTPETAQPVPTNTLVPTPAPDPTTPVAAIDEDVADSAQPAVPLPLDSLPDTPRINPENAWSLRRSLSRQMASCCLWQTETPNPIWDTTGCKDFWTCRSSGSSSPGALKTGRNFHQTGT